MHIRRWILDGGPRYPNGSDQVRTIIWNYAWFCIEHGQLSVKMECKSKSNKKEILSLFYVNYVTTPEPTSHTHTGRFCRNFPGRPFADLCELKQPTIKPVQAAPFDGCLQGALDSTQAVNIGCNHSNNNCVTQTQRFTLTPFEVGSRGFPATSGRYFLQKIVPDSCGDRDQVLVVVAVKELQVEPISW